VVHAPIRRSDHPPRTRPCPDRGLTEEVCGRGGDGTTDPMLLPRSGRAYRGRPNGSRHFPVASTEPPHLSISIDRRLQGGPMVEEAQSEAHVPAQQSPPRQEARLSSSHGHSSRSERSAFPSSQGPRSPVGLIWRIRDRRSFVELRRRGRRAHAGCVTVTFAAAPAGTPAEPPRVAFALSRKVGSAVARNRVRRQIQAHLRSVAVSMAPGAYMFTLRPGAAELDRSVLLGEVDACLSRLVARAS
jgi:ribonuclease P protein component